MIAIAAALLFQVDPQQEEWFKQIQKEVGQPPQAVLDYVRKYPYVQKAIQDAAAFVKMDPAALGGMLFAELDRSRVPDSVARGEGPEYVVDSYGAIGIDVFADRAAALRRKGYLPKDVDYRVDEGIIRNEARMPLRVATFRTLRDAVFALAAVAREREDRARDYLKDRGIDNPSRDELTIATYVYYNAANPANVLNRLRARGPLDRAGFRAPSWRVMLQLVNAAQNAGRALANARLLQMGGVFPPPATKRDKGLVQVIEEKTNP